MDRVYENYRLQAEYCERKADNAPTTEISASWHRLAAEWMSLIPQAEPRVGTLRTATRQSA